VKKRRREHFAGDSDCVYRENRMGIEAGKFVFLDLGGASGPRPAATIALHGFWILRAGQIRRDRDSTKKRNWITGRAIARRIPPLSNEIANARSFATEVTAARATQIVTAKQSQVPNLMLLCG
jgi:hypothetical protein